VSAEPGLIGVYTAGTTNWLPETAELAPWSDVDVMVVLDGEPREKLGKLRHEGILLDVTYLQADRLGSAEALLGSHHVGASFRRATIILDPAGRLVELQSVVARQFNQRRWVLARCEAARAAMLGYLGVVPTIEPLHEKVTCWLFGTSLSTQMVLLAGLRNPTVRRRYAAARDVLAEYGLSAAYETFLDHLGCRQISRERVEYHLANLTELFDVAAVTARTPFVFLSDISPVARPISIDGTRALIESGSHREAVFWIVATQARCQGVLYRDAPEATRERFAVGLWELLGDLAIDAPADLLVRAERSTSVVPDVWAVVEQVVAANPKIE
jgi:hypothetical protein